MRPKSNTLFHFTKNQDSLKKILLTGFWPRLSLEDVRWYNSEMDFLALPIVCFCDIPLSRINDHVEFYGKYGLGLSKEWAINNGLNPILYVSDRSVVSKSLPFLSWAPDYYPKEARENARLEFLNVLAHTKPIEGQMSVGENLVKKEFYQENEWRYFARHEKFKPYLNEKSYSDTEKRDTLNNLTKEFCSLKVKPQDIKYIFVEKDLDIPSIVNFIQTELDEHPGIEQKILMSRIVSLESIRHDL